MAENFNKANKTSNYEVDHTKFGGVIYPSDFYTNYTNGNIASRIIHDWSFDNQCKRNIEGRDKEKKVRN